MQPFGPSRGCLGMMKTTNMLYARPGATAIAAVLALSSTPLAAQDVPAPSEPVVVAPPVPTTATPAPEVAPVTDTAAPTTEPAAKPAAKPTVAKRTAAPKRTTTASTANRAASRPAAEAAAPAPSASAASDAVPRPAPIVDTTPPETAAPVAAPAPAPVASNGLDERAIELGAGALAIIGLGAAAVAMSRRRRRVSEEEAWTDETYEPVETVAAAPVAEPVLEPMAKPVTSTIRATPRHDPVVEPQPLIVAPPLSAFNWGNPEPTSVAATGRTTDAPVEDRMAGETWVERAQRGPTPDNPSLSLRKRLKRAAFFDKREREVAAGHAPQVEPDAGLPDNIDTSELEAA